MFVVQIIVNYIRPVLEWIPSSVLSPHDTLISIAAFAKSIAPVSTLIVEFSVGGLMVLGSLMPVPDGKSRFNLQSMGSLSALAFHLMVCFVPAPNDISGFALNCAPRHIVFASVYGTSAAVDYIRQLLFPLSASLAVGVAIGLQNQWTENNWAFFLYVYVASFVAMSILLNTKIQKEAPQNRTTSRPFWLWIAVGIAFFYSFGTLMLGLQEETTANMFANLKSGHGGSNHYILPTGLLFHWFAAAGDTHPFGGGVIRIEQTTSDWFRTIYPADLTSFLQPDGVVSVMEAIGSPPPIYFNPGANRNLRLITEPPGLFYRYTVPALEFKRLLDEAMNHDEDFVLTYSKLPGTYGDEVWRATATQERVTIQVQQGHVVKCEFQKFGNGKKFPCIQDSLPYVNYTTTVPWIIRRISLYHAYPITVPEDTDVSGIPASIVCFGP
jgi:hypothetical protein